MQFVLHCSIPPRVLCFCLRQKYLLYIMPRLGTIRLWMRDFYQKKLRQTYRISRKTLDFASLVLSTALAVLFS